MTASGKIRKFVLRDCSIIRGAPIGRRNGFVLTITHLAFYAGWPNAIIAITVAKDVFERR
jgi:hypothetical protein